MRVERADHAVDGVGQQLVALHRLDVVGLDDLDHLRQLAQAVERHAGLDRLVGQRGKLHRDRDAGNDADGQQAGVLQSGTHRSDSNGGARPPGTHEIAWDQYKPDSPDFAGARDGKRQCEAACVKPLMRPVSNCKSRRGGSAMVL